MILLTGTIVLLTAKFLALCIVTYEQGQRELLAIARDVSGEGLFDRPWPPLPPRLDYGGADRQKDAFVFCSVKDMLEKRGIELKCKQD